MKLNQVDKVNVEKFYNSSNITVGSVEDIFSYNIGQDVESIIIIAAIVLACLIFLCFVSRPRNTSICFLNLVQFSYEWCCCRLDCASKLNSNEAIMRYTEEPPLHTDDFVHHVLDDEYMKSILNTFALELPEYFLSILPTGSLREGFGKILPSTSILASDFDIMLIPDAALAGDATKTYKGNERPLFATVESKEIEEGFLWLRLENEYMMQWKDLCIRRQTEGQGCSYLSSHRVHDMIRNTFLKSEWATLPNKNTTGSKSGGVSKVERNGPALTFQVTTRRLRTCGMKCCKKLWNCCEKERDEILFYCDFTFSLHCPQWPDKSSMCGLYSSDVINICGRLLQSNMFSCNNKFEPTCRCLERVYTLFFIRNLAQGLIPKVPYFWTSSDHLVVLKVP